MLKSRLLSILLIGALLSSYFGVQVMHHDQENCGQEPDFFSWMHFADSEESGSCGSDHTDGCSNSHEEPCACAIFKHHTHKYCTLEVIRLEGNYIQPNCQEDEIGLKGTPVCHLFVEPGIALSDVHQFLKIHIEPPSPGSFSGAKQALCQVIRC